MALMMLGDGVIWSIGMVGMARDDEGIEAFIRVSDRS
jgi:hypothetical protein